MSLTLFSNINRKCLILILRWRTWLLLAPKALSDEQKEAAGGQRATITLRVGEMANRKELLPRLKT